MKQALSIRFFIGETTRKGTAVGAGTDAGKEATALLCSAFPCHTLTHGIGVWNGTHEHSKTIEAIVEDSLCTREHARDVARTLARILDQECIGLAFRTLDAFELVGNPEEEDA